MRMIGNKDKTKTSSPYPLPSSLAQLQLFDSDSLTPPHWMAHGIGNGGWWSVHNSPSLLFLPPYTFPWSATGPSLPSSARKHLPFHSLSQNFLRNVVMSLKHTKVPDEARSFTADGFSYPAWVVSVGDVAAHSWMHRTSIHTHCLVWWQDWSVQSLGAWDAVPMRELRI